MQEQDKPKRGGARPGSGIKRGTVLVPPERRARKICLSVRGELYEKLIAEAEKTGETVPATIVGIVEKSLKKSRK